MVLPPVLPRPDRLPLNDPSFSWDRFESFCLDFISRLPGVINCHRYGKQGDCQQGIDILAQLENGEQWAFQCKQYESFTQSDAKKAVQKAIYRATHYVLLLTCEATVKVRDVIAATSAWSLWDVQDISLKVRSFSQDTARRIVETHFGFMWSEAFLGVAESVNLNSFSQPDSDSSSLVKKIRETFDRDWIALEHQSRTPNGIALSRLAHLAVEEEGDFDAAIEALMSLLRLAQLQKEKGLLGGLTTEERKDGILTNQLVTQSNNAGLQSPNHKATTGNLEKLTA